MSADRPNPLHEIAVTILAPSLVLMVPAGTAGIPALGWLGLALLCPLGWGIYDFNRRRKFNLLALLGVVSTLMTGGIGLMQLDAQWLAIKEAALPTLMGTVIAASAFTQRPLIHALVFDAALLDTVRIQNALAERGQVAQFERHLQWGTLALGAVFMASGAAGYGLARWVVHSPAGSDAFNQELGRMTLLGWPMITLPTMLALAGLMWALLRSARQLSGLDMGQLFQPPPVK